MSAYRKERRKLLRRKTYLESHYWKHSSYTVFDKIEKAIVVDLSTGGCRIHVSDGHNLHRNDTITLVFKLDDPDRTEIQQEAVIRWVLGNFAGCKFSYKHGDKV
jgi:c-di-GMP-binding flagellar brake protein YcgR